MRTLALAFGLVMAAATFVSACDRSAASTAAAQDRRIYSCPMHCKLPGHAEPYTQRGPGDCPVCGMHLVPQ